jgi:hypothetical protein
MRITSEAEVQDAELVLYRDRTAALLNKYFRMSVERGHLPSVMGREFFRSHVTSYGTHTFEDAVIFVRDVERCLERISKQHQVMISRLFFQQYTNDETAVLMGCGVSTFERWRREAVNALAKVLLERKLLEKMTITDYESVELDCEDGDQPPPKKPVKSVLDIQAVAVLA